MATRLPYGAEINYDVLDRIADGEAWLHTLFGAEENLRLRVHGDVVRLEIAPERMGEVLEKREEMIAYLKKLGFSYLTMDLEGFRSGSRLKIIFVLPFKGCPAGSVASVFLPITTTCPIVVSRKNRRSDGILTSNRP